MIDPNNQFEEEPHNNLCRIDLNVAVYVFKFRIHLFDLEF